MDFKRFRLAAGTFGAAMGIGFIMQNFVDGQAGAVTNHAPVNAQIIEDGQEITLSSLVLTAAYPVPPKDRSVPVRFPDTRPLRVAATPAVLGPMPKDEPSPSFSCDSEITVAPAAAAMVDLVLNAPCRAGERVTLHHNGMMLTEVLDETGQLRVTLPAFNTKAVFIASFAIGPSISASVDIPSLAFYDRVAVQWRGAQGFELHALEFGAEFGSSGHVSLNSDRDLSAILNGKGGMLTFHGASDIGDAQIAEVYTFPHDTVSREGIVNFSVEAEVTAQNCGREVEGESLQITQGAGLRVRDINISMPDCDAIGDYLVLPNLLDDLMIARN